jgi:hypothetical protein|tara:strand:+ start:2638 stop:2940 length:303 start_codon:yes stop_codon:yes gene_type:complete
MESKNPPHYQNKSIQTCDAIMSQMTPEENIGGLRFNALKYLCRFGSKGGQTIDGAIIDLEKSSWYIEKLIKFLKKCKKEGAELEDTPANVTNLFKGKDKK